MLTFSKYITTAQFHSARQPLSHLYKPKSCLHMYLSMCAKKLAKMVWILPINCFWTIWSRYRQRFCFLTDPEAFEPDVPALVQKEWRRVLSTYCSCRCGQCDTRTWFLGAPFEHLGRIGLNHCDLVFHRTNRSYPTCHKPPQVRWIIQIVKRVNSQKESRILGFFWSSKPSLRK